VKEQDRPFAGGWRGPSTPPAGVKYKPLRMIGKTYVAEILPPAKRPPRDPA
jgi:hypothetical protein